MGIENLTPEEMEKKAEAIMEDESMSEEREMSETRNEIFQAGREQGKEDSHNLSEEKGDETRENVVLQQDKGLKGDPQSYEKPRIVKVQRSSGEIEDDWKLVTIKDGRALVMKETLNPKRVLTKSISQTEFESLNSSEESKYIPGKQVTVRRSSGAIESDWVVGDRTRILDGKKLITVYKGEYPPKAGALYKEIYQEELDGLNQEEMSKGRDEAEKENNISPENSQKLIDAISALKEVVDSVPHNELRDIADSLTYDFIEGFNGDVDRFVSVKMEFYEEQGNADLGAFRTAEELDRIKERLEKNL